MNTQTLPCRVSAELNAYQRQVDENSTRFERLEREFDSEHAEDAKLEILHSIGQPGDPYDFFDFICCHKHQDSLTLIGFYACYPHLKPADWDDTRSVQCEADVANMRDEFVEERLEAKKEQWVEKEMERPEAGPEPEGY